MTSKCKLCQKNSDLRKSHIVSETFYERIYDQKHRILPISLDNPELKFAQKGIRERLLCSECELKLSKLENTLKRHLIDIGNKSSSFLKISQISEQQLKVEGIKYKEFKLAILSILWRMSVTTDSFFSSYELGGYEEKLRKMLVVEDASCETKYPIMVWRYECQDGFDPGLYTGFSPIKYDQLITVQSFIIWGHRFRIFVNDKIFPKLPIERFLRDFGELYIPTRSVEELVYSGKIFPKLKEDKVRDMYSKMV